LTITKKLDKATPRLFLYAAAGNHIRRVTLLISSIDAPQMIYRFDEVRVTSITHSGNGHDGPLPGERVAFDYLKVKLEFKVPDGTSAVETLSNDLAPEESF
jgi:type VI secretion system secreted protein Hcp